MAETGTLLDYGFEAQDADHDDGDTLVAEWVSYGTPQHREYDTAQAKVGSQSAWLQGATSGDGGLYHGALNGQSGDNLELRCWMYFENATSSRYVRDFSAQTIDVYFKWNGNIEIYTSQNVDVYTTGWNTLAGTYSTGWLQIRIIWNFTGAYYTLDTRTTIGGEWTSRYKTGAANAHLPTFSATPTSMGNLAWVLDPNVQIWIDEVRWSTSAISDGDENTLSVNVAPSNSAYWIGAPRLTP